MDILQQLINGLSLGALYALIAVGYTVVYGIIQLINFAHGEIFMIGAFGALTAWILIPGESLGIWQLPIMLVVGMVAAVGTSLLTERFAYRPLRNAPRLAPLITAIGVSVFLQEFVRLFYGRIPGFPDARRAIPFPQIDYVTGPAIQIGSHHHPACRAVHRDCARHLLGVPLRVRQPHAPRSGNAGDIAGPRHREADGYQC